MAQDVILEGKHNAVSLAWFLLPSLISTEYYHFPIVFSKVQSTTYSTTTKYKSYGLSEPPAWGMGFFFSSQWEVFWEDVSIWRVFSHTKSMWSVQGSLKLCILREAELRRAKHIPGELDCCSYCCWRASDKCPSDINRQDGNCRCWG